METKLNTNQLGNNETVFTESSLVSGENVLIQKHTNPNVITEDTVYLWHFDGSRVDAITGTVQFPLSGEFSDGQAYVDITPFTTGKSYKGAEWYWINYDGHMVRVADNTFGVNKSFTIDFWLVGTLSASAPITAGFTSGSNSSSKRFFLTLEPGTNGTLVKIIASSTSNLDNVVTSVDIPTSEVNLGNWVHVAFVYDSLTHTATAYFNGVNKLTCVLDWDTIDISWYTTAIKYLFVGGSIGTASCKIDELRISKSAVWETNFEVPTEPYAEEGSTPDYFELKTSGLVKETDLTAFTGTDGTAAGTAGLVPAPATTDAGKYLKADGTWDTPAGGTDLTTITNYKAGIPQQLINTENGLMWGSKERWYSNFKNGNKLEIYFNCPSSNPTTADIIWQVTTQQHTATDGKGAQNMLTMDTTSNPKSILYGDATDGALLGYFDSSTITYFTNSIGATDSTRWLRIHRENGDNVLYALNDDNYSIDALPDLTSWELQGTLSGASIISGFGFSTNSDWGFKGTLKNLVIIFDDEKLFDLRYGNNVYDNASGGWNSHIIVEEKWV